MPVRALRVIDWGALIAALAAATLVMSVGIAVLERLDHPWPRAAFDAIRAAIWMSKTIVIPVGLGGIFFAAVLIPLDRTEWFWGGLAGLSLAGFCAWLAGGFDRLAEAGGEAVPVLALAGAAGALGAFVYNRYDETRSVRSWPSGSPRARR